MALVVTPGLGGLSSTRQAAFERAALADSATWWVAGSFPLSGTKTKAQFLELFGGVGGATEGGLKLTCKGITAEGDYRFQNIHQVAKRFGVNAAVIKQLLADFQLDPDTVIHSGFDMAGAQDDVMLAPEGINRIELARDLYAEFLAAPRRARNWAKELEEAARSIATERPATGERTMPTTSIAEAEAAPP